MPAAETATDRRDEAGNPALRLLLASFLMLFLELALIRWLGANIVHLSYFSNFVLLGSFLGIGAGFLVGALVFVFAMLGVLLTGIVLLIAIWLPGWLSALIVAFVLLVVAALGQQQHEDHGERGEEQHGDHDRPRVAAVVVEPGDGGRRRRGVGYAWTYTSCRPVSSEEYATQRPSGDRRASVSCAGAPAPPWSAPGPTAPSPTSSTRCGSTAIGRATTLTATRPRSAPRSG